MVPQSGLLRKGLRAIRADKAFGSGGALIVDDFTLQEMWLFGHPLGDAHRNEKGCSRGCGESSSTAEDIKSVSLATVCPIFPRSIGPILWNAAVLPNS